MKNGSIGLCVGITLNEIIAVIASCRLNFGYYMPCLSTLPEQVGDEMNAMILLMVICGIIGMSTGIAAWAGCRHQEKLAKRGFGAAGMWRQVRAGRIPMIGENQ
ncbi:MAG: hypothetical protein PHI27_10150 [Eubacteriales bacterium]|nr:hypothetical protein [Eubacteriales bacterium]MDD4513437.1 hypothetical protein [Eubacteriales bacterium]